MRRSRRLSVVACTLATLASVPACMDLFHSTEFETLCSRDAAACAPEANIDAGDSEAPDAVEEPIDFCGYSFPEAREHAERVCAWMGACFGASEESSFGACVVRALAAYSCSFNPNLRPRGELAALWKCLADVGSCDEASRCLFSGAAPTCVAAQHGTFSACGAHRPASPVVECGSSKRPLSIQACALEGRSCATVSSDKGICAGLEGATCAGPTRCDGTFAVQCTSGAIPADLGLDCAGFGDGRCALDDAGAACAPDDDALPCDGSSAIECGPEGEVRSCVEGKLVMIHCGELGQRCTEGIAPPSAPMAACTNPFADRCTSGPDDCSVEGKLRSCAQGTLFELDCAHVGLGPCVDGDAGAGATCSTP